MFSYFFVFQAEVSLSEIKTLVKCPLDLVVSNNTQYNTQSLLSSFTLVHQFLFDAMFTENAFPPFGAEIS